MRLHDLNANGNGGGKKEQEQFDAYMRTTPWVAVPFGELKVLGMSRGALVFLIICLFF